MLKTQVFCNLELMILILSGFRTQDLEFRNVSYDNQKSGCS